MDKPLRDRHNGKQATAARAAGKADHAGDEEEEVEPPEVVGHTQEDQAGTADQGRRRAEPAGPDAIDGDSQQWSDSACSHQP